MMEVNTTLFQAETEKMDSSSGGRMSPKTWGESLMMYKIEKSIPVYGKHLPQVHRATRDKSSEWREKDRELNPVLQSFIDPGREEKQRTKEEGYKKSHFLRAQDRSVVNTSVYNILTLENYQEREEGQRQLYLNKLSNKTESIKITRNPNDTSRPSKDPIDAIARKKKFYKVMSEYDNVYNRYFNDDEEEHRKLNDFEKLNQSALAHCKKLQSRSNYYLNPLFPTDATDIEKLEKQARDEFGTKRKVIPQHMVFQESNGYDILKTDLVLDQSIIDQVEKREKIPLAKHFKNNASELEVKKNREIKSNQTQFRRTMNKSTHARLRDEFSTPYHLLSNKSYVGIDSIPPPINLSYMRSDERSRTVWQNATIQREDAEQLLDNTSPKAKVFSGRRKKSAWLHHQIQGTERSVRSVIIPQKMSKDTPSVLYDTPALKLGKSGRICVDNVVVYPVKERRDSCPSIPAISEITKRRRPNTTGKRKNPH